MQIFLSYSHEDVAFARYLNTALQAAGVDLWIDEERLIAGNRNLERIIEETRRSEHAIFLVSRSWLTKDWTLKELSLFETRDAALCRRIAVLLTRRGDIRDALPPALAQLSHIEWLPDDPEPDARLWEVFCAVKGLAPGSRQEWAAKGRDLQKASQAHATPPPLPLPANESPSLCCDRERQWTDLDQFFTPREHRIMFLIGARGEAHDSFLRRIELRFQIPLVCRVTWASRRATAEDGRPSGEAEFRDAIARALNVQSGALVETLNAMLATRHVLLLHDRICDDYEDGQLIRYFTEYLPRLVEDVGPVMTLKCVSPVEWLPRPGMTRLLRWLNNRSLTDDERRARRLVDVVQAQVRTPCVANALHELESITEAHIRGLCTANNLGEPEVSRLIDRIRAARTSEEKLTIFDDFIRERRRSPSARKDPDGRPLQLATVPR